MKKELQFILRTMKYPAAWKSESGLYQECNEAFANMFYLSPAEIINKHDNDLPWMQLKSFEPSNLNQQFIYYINENSNQLIQTQQQLLTGSQNERCGTLVTVDKTKYNIYKILDRLYDDAKTTPKSNLIDLKLTKRETEIMFLLQLGKSVIEIAELLSNLNNKIIKPSTINSIICKKLYKKFGVKGYTELIEVASQYELRHRVIPGSFMKHIQTQVNQTS